MLARATEGTEAPTPGYLYIDLAKNAQTSPVACHDMAQYLTRRLGSKSNPHIKYKCCKVITKLCENVPRNQFRRALAQDAQAVSVIKESIHFRGTPDPVRGDEPNQKVRQAAKEALDAVYSEAPTSAEPQYSGGMSQSYAPSPHQQQQQHYGGQGGFSGGGPRRMEGMGNPRYQDPRFAQHQQQPSNFVEAVTEAKDVIVNMIKDPLARNIDVPPAQHIPRQGYSPDLPGFNRGGAGQVRVVSLLARVDCLLCFLTFSYFYLLTQHSTAVHPLVPRNYLDKRVDNGLWRQTVVLVPSSIITSRLTLHRRRNTTSLVIPPFSGLKEVVHL